MHLLNGGGGKGGGGRGGGICPSTVTGGRKDIAVYMSGCTHLDGSTMQTWINFCYSKKLNSNRSYWLALAMEDSYWVVDLSITSLRTCFSLLMLQVTVLTLGVQSNTHTMITILPEYIIISSLPLPNIHFPHWHVAWRLIDMQGSYYWKFMFTKATYFCIVLAHWIVGLSQGSSLTSGVTTQV